MPDDLTTLLKQAPDEEVRDAIRGLKKDELLALLDRTRDYASPYETKFDLYQPVPAAVAYHASPARVRAAFGGNRSSKTTSAMVDVLSQCFGRYPQSVSPPA